MTQPLPVSDEFRVTDDEGAVSRARARIVAVVDSWDLPFTRDAIDDVKLCSSEVITNALRHGGGTCDVRVEWTGSCLKVEVTDFNPRLPTVLPPDAEATSGRGLTMVEAFAHSWGWSPRGAGKTVYFLVAADAVLSGDERLTSLARTAHGQLQEAFV